MNTDNLRTVTLDQIIDLPIYSVANVLPILEKFTDEHKKKTITLAELADDIHKNGLLDPIVLYKVPGSDDTMILDGRNRRLACELAAKTYKTPLEEFKLTVVDFNGSRREARDFVFSKGFNRRDMDPNQRAMSAAMFEYECPEDFAEMKEEAQKAMVAGVSNPRPQMGEGPSERAYNVNQMLANIFHVSRGLVEDARRLLRDERSLRESAEADAAEAEAKTLAAKEAEAKLELAKVTGDTETVKKAAIEKNAATNAAAELREKAAEKAQKASELANSIDLIHEGQKRVRENIPSPGQEIKPDDPLAGYRQQFNSADNKWHEAAKELLKSDRPEDVENVRRRKAALDAEFDGIEEIELQTDRYFPTEREPSDTASRWAGEVRIRLAGVDRMIQEKDVLPSMVTKNLEFVEVIDRLRKFLDDVEDSLNGES